MCNLQPASRRLDHRAENRAMKSTSVPVLNSLIYVRDSELEDLPEINGLTAYWATKSCVAVSCLPDSEGNTTITIGTGPEVAQNRSPLFDRKIETPSHTVLVETVLANTILCATVPRPETRLRIWTNGHRATDSVIVALDKRFWRAAPFRPNLPSSVAL